MRVGLVGTGAIAHKHGDGYRAIGYRLVGCSNRSREKGEAFAEKYGCEFVGGYEELCRRDDIDYIDVCTFPDSHLEICRAAVANGKHVLLQKPMALTLDACRRMIALCESAGLCLGVVSQHRFDECSIFLKKALAGGRLGKLLQVDGYVKWHRPQSYYDRPGKGAWAVEGGGALINQGIHTVDVMQYLGGRFSQVFANWQLGAAHVMEGEDIVNAVVAYENGATGVVQASTAVLPGYPERIELHGSKGSAVITGDRLTAWDVEDDLGAAVPLAAGVESGAADPMAISIENLKLQFLDFGKAVEEGRAPLVDGEEGFRALQIVLGIYESARGNKPVKLT